MAFSNDFSKVVGEGLAGSTAIWAEKNALLGALATFEGIATSKQRGLILEAEGNAGAEAGAVATGATYRKMGGVIEARTAAVVTEFSATPAATAGYKGVVPALPPELPVTHVSAENTTPAGVPGTRPTIKSGRLDHT